MTDQKPSRREAILHALVELLETDPGARITTAGLAKSVGVTEAALYRHFPSKRKMFEALIEFAEEAVFSRCQVILQEQEDVRVRLQQLVHLVLVFAERNPGLCCVLTGDALMGENDTLRKRASQFFERLETQLKQVLREAELREGRRTSITASAAANLLIAQAEGRISQYVRSDFKRLPTEYWEDQWTLLSGQLFRNASQPA